MLVCYDGSNSDKDGEVYLEHSFPSTNAWVYVELGWKPTRLLVSLAKLRYFKRSQEEDFVGCELVQAVMAWNITLTWYPESAWAVIPISKSRLGNWRLDCKETTLLLSAWNPGFNIATGLIAIASGSKEMVDHIQSLFKCNYVITKFRCMNAGLGNRDGYRLADAASNTGGRVNLCPLCL